VVNDLAKLVQSRRVVPGKAAESKLLKRVLEGNMPPREDFEAEEGAKPPPRPGPEDVKVLQAWIDAGAPSGAAAPAALRVNLSELDVLKLVLDDLRSLPPRGRRFARYFTLVHLANAGDNADQLATYRHGLAKLVNSLSWSRKIAVPVALGPAGAILRVDMRDYGWGQDVWQAILEQYPYALQFQSVAAREVAAVAMCELPYVRADWFVFAASRPPLYHEVLRLPNSDGELEQQLHIDVPANIAQERVARAGFSESGVSRNNRLVERHDSGYGAYWKSYDFAGNADRKNLFSHPLGPGDGEYDFEQDGGEIIFSLPNGLQAYMLVDGAGKRIDRGPTNVVRDPKQSDGSVVNGVSCMSCHSRGLIEKSDQLHDLVERSSPFPKEVTEVLLALYPTPRAFDVLLREDAERFVRAVKATGASLSQTEPVYALARQFEVDLDVKHAAAEAGLEPSAFRDLLAGTPALGQALGPLLLNSPVKRDAFLAAFPLIAEARHLTLFVADGGPPAPVARAEPAAAALTNPFVPAAGPRPGSLPRTKNEPVSLTRPRPRLPLLKLDLARFVDCEPSFKNHDGYFRDFAPRGGILVGLRFTYHRAFNSTLIQSVQPIYQAGSTLSEGSWHGPAEGPGDTLLARPGYAIGSLTVRTGLVLNGFSATFQRIENGGLSLNDQYDSPWYGLNGGAGRTYTSAGKGRPIVGIQGRLDRVMHSLGLIMAP
jgi:hypothetical protein